MKKLFIALAMCMSFVSVAHATEIEGQFNTQYIVTEGDSIRFTGKIYTDSNDQSMGWLECKIKNYHNNASWFTIRASNFTPRANTIKYYNVNLKILMTRIAFSFDANSWDDKNGMKRSITITPDSPNATFLSKIEIVCTAHDDGPGK